MIAIAIIGIVIAIVSAVVAYQQQQAAAQAQAKYQTDMMRAQEEAMRQNAALANEAYMNQTKALQERQRQSDEMHAQQEQQVGREAQAARSTAMVAAGEAGVAGLSVTALLDDFSAQEARFRLSSQSNLDFEHRQTGLEVAGLRGETEGRINQMQPYRPEPIKYPSLAGAALRAGSDSMGSAQTLYKHYKGKV